MDGARQALKDGNCEAIGEHHIHLSRKHEGLVLGDVEGGASTVPTWILGKPDEWRPALHYRKLLIRTTSLVSFPLATNSVLPSLDHAKLKIRPEGKSVT